MIEIFEFKKSINRLKEELCTMSTQLDSLRIENETMKETIYGLSRLLDGKDNTIKEMEQERDDDVKTIELNKIERNRLRKWMTHHGKSSDEHYITNIIFSKTHIDNLVTVHCNCGEHYTIGICDALSIFDDMETSQPGSSSDPYELFSKIPKRFDESPFSEGNSKD